MVPMKASASMRRFFLRTCLHCQALSAGLTMYKEDAMQAQSQLSRSAAATKGTCKTQT